MKLWEKFAAGSLAITVGGLGGYMAYMDATDPTPRVEGSLTCRWNGEGAELVNSATGKVTARHGTNVTIDGDTVSGKARAVGPDNLEDTSAGSFPLTLNRSTGECYAFDQSIPMTGPRI